MNTLKQIFTEYGITVRMAKDKGVNGNTLTKHLSGERQIGVKCALLYERLLGIPRYVLRPDLWEAPTHAQQ